MTFHCLTKLIAEQKIFLKIRAVILKPKNRSYLSWEESQKQSQQSSFTKKHARKF